MTLPMTARGWATEIITELAANGLELPLELPSGFTTQDVVNSIMERAMAQAASGLEWRNTVYEKAIS